MKVLLLGGGGREHALAWKLRQSPQVDALWALPGSDALAGLASCVPGDPCDAAQVLAAVVAHAIDFTVIGPEAPLAAGVADGLRAAGHVVFGPDRKAAQLEASKIFAKEFMARHQIPTAAFAVADATSAGAVLDRFAYPLVIKADGLAAGKGVVIAADRVAAAAALEELRRLGAASAQLVIEECLTGPEVSVLALCDGERYVTLAPARDHKRLGEGDTGPNTGGMGAFCEDALLSPAARDWIEKQVIARTLAGMAREGTPFQGVLYCGLMLTAAGPRVLEFNARFGDPETQAILPRFRGDLAEWLWRAASGALPERAPAREEMWHAGAAACVIAAAAGYPGTPRRGDAIQGLAEAGAEATVFHAGTRLETGTWRTNGGRVLGVAARGADRATALAACYAGMGRIAFQGMQYRRDIGAASFLEENL